jgi:hypothetical protein
MEKQEMEQIMEILVRMETDRKAWREKVEADRKIDKEERKADRVQTQQMMKMLQAYQAKTDAILPAIQVRQTSCKETIAVIKPNEVETMACQGMEARQIEEKPTSPDRKPEAAKQRKVPAEYATEIPVGEPKKKRRKDRKLTAQHRRQKTKTSTRENCGSQTRLAVTRRGTTRRAKVARKAPIDRKMSRRATPARRMRDIVKRNRTQGTGGFPRKRLVMADKKITRCVNMAEHKRLRLQGDQSDPRTSLHKDVLEKARQELGSRKAIRLETTKRTLGTSSRLQEKMNWTLWRGRPPQKIKKGNGPYGRNRGKYRPPRESKCAKNESDV